VDNADLRLTPKAFGAGLVDSDRWHHFRERERRFRVNLENLRTPARQQLLRRPEVTLADLIRGGMDLEKPVSRLDVPSVETEVKFEGYLKRQQSDIARHAREEGRRIPSGFAYKSVPGLSAEVIQRLSQVKPETLGQASRIPGMTPAAVSVLSIYISRHP
jgi:tRNA uridine 5-carboxymethylaminomethyl modification enzyme